MVKLWSAIGYRIRIPSLTDEKFDEFQSDIYRMTLASFVERLTLPNHVVVVIVEGMAPAVEEYCNNRGYTWLPADVIVVTRIGRGRRK